MRIIVTYVWINPYIEVKPIKGVDNKVYNLYGTQDYNAYAPRQIYPPAAVMDSGPNPLVIDISKATLHNNTFRTALWTGKYFQLTMMSIPPGEDVGLEMHPNVDQFLRVEEGQGLVQMGSSKDHLYFKQPAYADYAIIIPAGTWHNFTNTGGGPLKLYSIYAPPNHPWGTVHQTKADAGY